MIKPVKINIRKKLPEPVNNKTRITKEVFGTINTAKFNERTKLFSTMLRRQVGLRQPLSSLRTFLNDNPVTFFQSSLPGKQSLFRLLFTRFVSATQTLLCLPTCNITSIFSYKETMRELYWVTRSYLLFFFRPAAEHFYFSRNFYNKVINIKYFLNFKFRRGKFFVNIFNSLNKNYLSLTPGLFLSFLKKKKAFKKNMLLKLLVMRFLRKMFISLTFANMYLRIRGVPLEFTKLLTTLNKPIIHRFMDPLSERLIDEKTPEYQAYLADNPIIHTPYIYFIKNKSYTFLKTRKRGRIKRKIRRKLVKLNNATD